MDLGARSLPDVAVVSAAVLAGDRSLPLAEPLADLLGRPASLGLARGQVVACTGGASTSLAFALAARAVEEGAWLAVIDVAWLGVEAVAGLGVPLERVVHVDTVLQHSPVTQTDAPGGSASAPPPYQPEPRDARWRSLNVHDSVRSPAPHDRAGQADAPGEPRDARRGSLKMFGRRWAEIVAATIDGFEIVITRPPLGATTSALRALRPRLQQRGAVLVTIGRHAACSPDIELRGSSPVWEQVSTGAGYLAARRVRVEASGRRLPRARQGELWLPSPTGSVEPIRVSEDPQRGLRHSGAPQHLDEQAVTVVEQAAG